MDNHAEDREFAKAGAVAKLDWPTPEMLAVAHRLRAKAFKEMAVDFGRGLRAWLAEHLLVTNPGRSRPRPATVRSVHRR